MKFASFFAAILLTLAFSTACMRFGQGPNKGWGRTLGCCTNAVTIDSTGNVITTGYFDRTVDFDPGPATVGREPGNKNNSFIEKIGADGKFKWVQTWDADSSNDIKQDPGGNLVVIGSFTGAADFDPGPDAVVQTANGDGSDAYLAKFGPSGNLQWLRTWGSSTYETDIGTVQSDDSGWAVEIDGAGNIYAEGLFSGEVDFGGSEKSEIRKAVDKRDRYLCKFDTEGNLIWVRTWAGGETEPKFPDAMSLNLGGNLLVAGTFTGTVDFNTGPEIDERSSSRDGSDYPFEWSFVTEFDPDGNFIWVKTWGSSRARGITTDSAGNIFICGSFHGTVDFDTGPDDLSYASASHMWSNDIGEFTSSTWDPYVLVLNKQGEFERVIHWGAWEENAEDSIQDIAVDDLGDIYCSGHFTKPDDFGNAVPNDRFCMVACVDYNGKIKWVNRWAIGDRDYKTRIVTDSRGFIYLIGTDTENIVWPLYFGKDFDKYVEGYLATSIIFKLNSEGMF